MSLVAMTDKARALAHKAIGCECKPHYDGKPHDEICDRVTAALSTARNEALEECITALENETEKHYRDSTSWNALVTATNKIRALIRP